MSTQKKIRGGHVCSAVGCKINSMNSTASFFRFPKDIERAKIWAMECGRNDLLANQNLYGGYRVCSAHFEVHMFLNDLRNRLQPHAIPRIYIEQESSSRSIDTPDSPNPSESSSKLPERSKRLHVDESCDEIKGILPQKVLRIEDIFNEEMEGMNNKASNDTEVLPGNLINQDENTKHEELLIAATSLSTPEEEEEDVFLSIEMSSNPTSESLLSPSSTQTPKSFTAHTPRKDKLRKTVSHLKKENSKLEKRLDVLENQLCLKSSSEITLEQYKAASYKFCKSKELADFINIQVIQIQKKPKGRRYTNEFKQHCSSMYFLGPKLYKSSLMKTFCLPGPRILGKFIEHIKGFPGIDAEVLKLLKFKIENFSIQNRMCILCVDEMSIKANLFYNITSYKIVGLEDFGMDNERQFKAAHAATVFMVRGMFSNWKQPLAYYFVHTVCSGPRMCNLVQSAITELKKIGLRVCALICDMGSNNIQMSKILNVSPEEPYFHVEDEKIVFMFDTPHLLKSVRNNLIKYDFIYNDKQISWQHIKRFYNHDKQYSIRAAPKLTDSHISPNNFEKMKVRFASQVFSATVAAGMNVYIRFEALPSGAVGTAEFVDKIDKLFDLLNSSGTSNCKEFQRAFKGLEYQVNFLRECYGFFDKVIILNSQNENISHKIKCLTGWKITLNGVLNLWQILKDAGFEYLFTRRASQDCLENFFGSARQQSGNCVNPTPIQFQRAFKKLLCINVMNSGTQNCQEDNAKILLKITELGKTMQSEIADIQTIETEKVTIRDIDYQSSDDLQKNFTRYISGYLINKCLKIHSCEICIDYAKSHEELDDSSLFCYFKAYQNASLDTFGNLKMPNDTFVYFISSMEVMFQQNFENIIVQRNCLQMFMKLYDRLDFQHPCIYFPYNYLKMLYSRVRLFYTYKYLKEISNPLHPIGN